MLLRRVGCVGEYRLVSSALRLLAAEDMVEATRQGEIGNQNSIIRRPATLKSPDTVGNWSGSMLEDKDGEGKHVRYGALYGHVTLPSLLDLFHFL